MLEPVPISLSNSSTTLLALRLANLTILVVLVTVHMRSLRVFRWEQSVSGGVYVTFCFAVLGLALCAGTQRCGGSALQVYLCCAGVTLLVVNAAVIWKRWKRAGELTLVVADLLDALGVPLKRQIMTKVILSSAAGLLMLLDLGIASYLSGGKNNNV